MHEIPTIAFLLFLALFCLVAQRLSRTVLTAPMVFIGGGVLAHHWQLVPPIASEASLHVLAEAALVVLLFLDAAKVDSMALGRRHVWPLRMLLIGLPLGFALGWLAGLILVPEWSVAMLGLAAAVLAPTDAALGQPVVSNSRIPERPRRALVVESGLNDGFALPIVLVMAAFAAPLSQTPEQGWLLFILMQLLLGPVAGLIVGCTGGCLLLWAKRAHATAEVYEGIGALALAGLCYFCATAIGGNGFIAAFVGGLGFGMIVQGRCAFVYEFTESEGQFLSWCAFFLLGALLVPEAIHALDWPVLCLILSSLIVVRPLAIWISLTGSDATAVSKIFFGWFGPRGLATALFALLVADRLGPSEANALVLFAVNAVWISAVLHGVTAVPGAALYARALERREAAMEHLAMPSDQAIEEKSS